MVEPMRSEPVRVSIAVPPPKTPPAPVNLRAVGRPGAVELRWDEARPGQYRYNVYAGGQKLNAEPIVAQSFEIKTDVEETCQYIVESVSKIAGGRSSVACKPLPPRTGPVFELAPDSGQLVAPAIFEGNELDLSKGGHFVVEPNDEFNTTDTFRFECSVKFDELQGSPVVVSHGLWNRSGWFLQVFNGRWRFHVDGVDCDAGSPKTGEWLHIVGTSDGLMIRLYENGNLLVQRPAPANRNPWLQNLVIGQYSGGVAPGFQVKGRIKDVRIGQR
jgi:hypothetical protein